jgi:hypothetical protein
MDEAKLKADLVQVFNSVPGVLCLGHNDHVKAGIPDLSVTCRGFTSWLEIKKSPVKSRTMQRTRMLQLAEYGSAFYVIYDFNRVYGSWTTYIVDPKDLDEWMVKGRSFSGIGHEFVANFIWMAHTP